MIHYPHGNCVDQLEGRVLKGLIPLCEIMARSLYTGVNKSSGIKISTKSETGIPIEDWKRVDFQEKGMVSLDVVV